MLVAALLFVPRVAAAQTTPPDALTLEAALARALQANQVLVAARLERPVAIAGVDLAGERLNPDVVYEAAKETPRQSIGATFPIELGGKRRRRVGLAEAGVASADAQFAQVAFDVRSLVRAAYFALVGANRRVTLAEDLRGLAARAHDAAQARFTAGDVPRIEVIQTELAQIEADNEATAERGEALALTAELNLLLGQAPSTPLTLVDDLTAGALPPVADAVALAEQSSVTLALIDRKLDEQSARIELARTLRTPDVTAGATYTFDAAPEFDHGWRALVGVTVPLLTRHAAAVVLENAALARLQAERAAEAASLRAAVTAALARASAARERLTRSVADSVPRADEVDRMAQDSYRSGQTGLVPLLQALQFTRDVRRRGLDAGLDYQRALADLERAIGAPLK